MSWPTDPRASRLAVELYESIASRPLVSVHNGLPARYLAEDLPLADPVNLLLSHDQGIQALLRAHGFRTEFSTVEGWQSEGSRRAFALVWSHMVEVRAQPWMADEGDRPMMVAGLPLFAAGRQPEAVYDELAAAMATNPVYPRRLLAAADIARLATSDEPADDLQAHEVLSEDPTWAGRVMPTFSPDRYLTPDRRLWRTDADLLTEITGIDTQEMGGFLEALRLRRAYFAAHGATATEHHSSDVTATRLSDREAAELYRLARSGELLPAENLALQGHLLWEMARMSADDGLVMGLYPPAGFHRSPGDQPARGDRGVAARIRPVVSDFGSADRFHLWLFSIDHQAYEREIVPLAQEHSALTAVPPTRFADDPVTLRSVRVAAVRAIGSTRALGLVDDMSGPFALVARHRLARRLDAGALAELVVAGQLRETQAYLDLSAALDRSILGAPVARAT